MATSKSAEVRKRLPFPIVDADGHYLEIEPHFLEVFREVAGEDIVARYRKIVAQADSYKVSVDERRETGVVASPWWGSTAETRDRATASLPGLMAERMEELGFDYMVLYPTDGLKAGSFQDEELRLACCRAVNTYQAEMFGEYTRFMTPAAVLPMYSPEEAIQELDYAVKVLGLKVAFTGSPVKRPIPSLRRQYPEAGREAYRLEMFGLDSEYDYDVLWEKFVELRVSPACHASGHGWGSRQSPSNYMYNQVGKFGAFSELLCKALFIGGVTRRFPTLGFAFLEGGVGWGCSLFADLLGRWEKRGAQAIGRLDPINTDAGQMVQMVEQYGSQRVGAMLEDVRDYFETRNLPKPEELDDFHACGIETVQDVYDLFVPHFYFGCEGDDPLNCWAFNTDANPLGARLRAMFGSDVGHWDVPDMSVVLSEAYELVEKEQMTEEDFKDFTFGNVVRLYGGSNPDFFEGTAVESAAATLLAQEAAA